jgi:hypothetical protein
MARTRAPRRTDIEDAGEMTTCRIQKPDTSPTSARSALPSARVPPARAVEPVQHQRPLPRHRGGHRRGVRPLPLGNGTHPDRTGCALPPDHLGVLLPPLRDVRLYDGSRWVDATPATSCSYRRAASMLLLFAPGAPREEHFETLADKGRTFTGAERRVHAAPRHLLAVSPGRCGRHHPPAAPGTVRP